MYLRAKIYRGASNFGCTPDFFAQNPHFRESILSPRSQYTFAALEVYFQISRGISPDFPEYTFGDLSPLLFHLLGLLLHRL